MTLWKVWYARNQLVFKNEKPNHIYIVEFVRSFVVGFNEANHQAHPLQHTVTADVPHV